MTDAKKQSSKRKLSVEEKESKKAPRLDVKEWFVEKANAGLRDPDRGWKPKNVPKWLLEAALERKYRTTADAWNALETQEAPPRINVENMKQAIRERFEVRDTARKAKLDAERDHAERVLAAQKSTREAERKEGLRQLYAGVRAELLAFVASVSFASTGGFEPQVLDLHITEEKSDSPFKLQFSELVVDNADAIKFKLSSPCAITPTNLRYMQQHSDAKLADLPDQKTPPFSAVLTPQREYVAVPAYNPHVRYIHHLEFQSDDSPRGYAPRTTIEVSFEAYLFPYAACS